MKKSTLTKVVPLSLATAATLGFAVSAHAMSFKVSGQIDRALTYANNGKNSAVGQVDNIGSNSRFRFTGDQAMGNGMKVGFIFELGVDKNGSASWDIGSGTSNSTNHFNVRKTNAYVEGNFGKFSFGRGDSAATYSETIDFSGTNWIGGGVWYELYGGGISFVDGNGNTITTVGKTQSPFNFLGRTNRVRYDTPSLHGLVLSASYSDGNAYALAARYNATLMNGIKFAAGLGYSDSENASMTHDPGTWQVTSGLGTRDRTIGGSASVLLPSGLNFTISSARQKNVSSGHSATNYFAQVGYTVGQNHFAVNYGQTKGLLNSDSGNKGSQIGAAYVYNWNHGVQLFASFHHYMLSTSAAFKASQGVGSAKDINQVYVGTRIQFL